MALAIAIEPVPLDVDANGVQDVNLSGVDDPTVLEWAAKQGRIVLTQIKTQ